MCMRGREWLISVWEREGVDDKCVWEEGVGDKCVWEREGVDDKCVGEKEGVGDISVCGRGRE